MKKITVIYGKAETGLQRKALEMLSRFLVEYTLEYPALYSADAFAEEKDRRYIFIGRRGENPYLKRAGEFVLSHEEEYRITVKDGAVYIEGFDDAGVLYGCIDFFDRYIVHVEYPDTDRYHVNAFERELPDFSHSSYPKVKNRGLWTWGHVIYDYRGYLDNMVKLKLNTLTVWNDRVPFNAKEFVAYAHDCGIKVIFGYSWLWSTECAKIPLDKLCDFSEGIFEQYEREYSALGADGIYFQSATELSEEKIGGIVIAEAVTNFVNHTAELFFKKYPELELQFGLHATSVKNKLDFIKMTDPRIRIVWENCGSFPFSYVPSDVSDFESTVDFVKKIAVLRGENDCFGVVTKGLTKLDWAVFEHPDAPLYVGVGTKELYQNREMRKRKIWKYLQAYWIAYADKAEEMVRVMQKAKKGGLYISALLEDGMFEKTVMYPAALYAEMLWDCSQDIKTLLSTVALRSCVEFA